MVQSLTLISSPYDTSPTCLPRLSLPFFLVLFLFNSPPCYPSFLTPARSSLNSGRIRFFRRPRHVSTDSKNKIVRYCFSFFRIVDPPLLAFLPPLSVAPPSPSSSYFSETDSSLNLTPHILSLTSFSPFFFLLRVFASSSLG